MTVVNILIYLRPVVCMSHNAVHDEAIANEIGNDVGTSPNHYADRDVSS